jgi:hypothetical protein
MDRIREEEAILPDLSGFLNLDNPVNPVYSFLQLHISPARRNPNI